MDQTMIDRLDTVSLFCSTNGRQDLAEVAKAAKWKLLEQLCVEKAKVEPTRHSWFARLFLRKG